MAGKSSQKYSQKQAVKQRIAAQRAQQQRAERNRRFLLIGSSSLVVIVVVAVLVIIAVTGSKDKGSSDGNDQFAAISPASSQLMNTLEKVPESAFNAVGTDLGSVPPKPPASPQPALTKDGKPEVLFVGGEFCPYCATERWSLAIALSRFGELHDVKTIFSSPTERGVENLPTLSFRDATYTSDYIAFVGKEIETRTRTGTPPNTLTPAENTLFQAHGGYPYVNFGGKWIPATTSVDPTLLKGLTHEQVMKQITDPNTKLGRAALESANVATAAICTLTNDQPGDVCKSATIQALETKLKAQKS